MHFTDPFPKTTLTIAARPHIAIRLLLGGVTAVMSSSVLAHPGHRHLDGASGDMHLHAFLSESAGGLLLLLAMAGVGLLWRRARRQDARRKVQHTMMQEGRRSL